MNNIHTVRLCAALTAAILMAACAPKVGSEAWCNDMKERPRGDWTLNQTADFARFCVLRLQPSSE